MHIIYWHERALAKVNRWIQKALPSEIGGFGLISPLGESDLLVRDAYLIPCTGSSAELDFTAEAIAQYSEWCDKNGVTQDAWFQWHSHANMDTFWSGTDKTLMTRLTRQTGKFAFSVLNAKGSALSAVWMVAPCLKPFSPNAPVIGQDWSTGIYREVDHDPSIPELADAEFAKFFKRASYTTYGSKWTDADEYIGYGYSGQSSQGETRSQVSPHARSEESIKEGWKQSDQRSLEKLFKGDDDAAPRGPLSKKQKRELRRNGHGHFVKDFDGDEPTPAKTPREEAEDLFKKQKKRLAVARETTPARTTDERDLSRTVPMTWTDVLALFIDTGVNETNLLSMIAKFPRFESQLRTWMRASQIVSPRVTAKVEEPAPPPVSEPSASATTTPAVSEPTTVRHVTYLDRETEEAQAVIARGFFDET